MISQSDIQGRMRLLRYGLAVLVVVAFLVSWLAPYAEIRPVYSAANLPDPGIGAFIGQAILITIVVAVLAVVIYFVYQNILQRTMKPAA